MWKSIIAISVGASGGALLRWFLGARLNAVFPPIPLGTLAANLIGGYVVGAAVAAFAAYAAIGPEWQLLVITGFCGGLTTFSTFSAEVTSLLQQGRALWACAAIGAHLGGSLLMTFAGIGTVAWVRERHASHVVRQTLQSARPGSSRPAPPDDTAGGPPT